MSKKIAFIGLGTMGYPMAGHLHAAQHRLNVYNRGPEKAARWLAQHGGHVANSPAGAAKDADFVISCVGNDDDLRQITTGPDGAFAAMQAGTVFIDHSTTSATLARALAETASAAGLYFLDAPVSGGQAGAENGQLTIMAGGDANAFARAEPILASYARAARLLGPAGSGQLTKMVNQICVGGLLQGLAEALAFGQRAGLDMQAVVDVISKGAAQSWQMENRAATMLKGEYEFGFAVDWMRKDFGLVLDEARRNGASLPVTAMVDQYYQDVQNMGGQRWDTSSLMARLTER